MLSVFRRVVTGLLNRTPEYPAGVEHHFRVLSAGLKTYDVPADYSDVVLPEKPKLKFLNKVPNLKKAKKEMKRLRDIQGPAKTANTFTSGQYGIVALGGGYLQWGHMEMMRLTINRRMDPRTTFARWRINAPYKPITRKGLGQRMGGGKGAIDFYVTPVKCGRLILEVGGHVELGEVEPVLKEVAKKLPFPAKEGKGDLMKPARGLARSTRGPNCKGRGGKLQLSKKQVRNDDEAQESSKKSSASAGVRQVKGRDKWKPLPKSSVVVLDNMLGLSILSVLTMKMKGKEESQKHLNLLQKQFLAKCSQLPVPPQKYGNLMQVSRQFQTESQKVTQGKKKIEALEESTRLVLSSLEQLQGEMDSLEHKCRILRDKLEEAELNAQEFIQLTEQAVLCLPALAPYPNDEPTLQEQIMEVMPNPQAVMKALQNSKVVALHKQRL